MEAFAADVAAAAVAPVHIDLSGALAAGKTTFARGFVHARGHRGAVKSPTFTLVESYELPAHSVHHFDLYRIADAEELEYLGLDEYFGVGADCLVEWPERGAGILPPPDLALAFAVVAGGRDVTLTAHSPLGREIVRVISLNP